MKKAAWILIIGMTAGLAYGQEMRGAGSGRCGLGSGCRPARMQGRGAGPEAGIGRLLCDPAMAKEAGLEEQEIARLRDACFAQREQMIDLEAKVQKARLRMQKLSADAGTDPALVEAAIEEIGLLETEIEKAAFRHRHQIRTILGDERMDWALKRCREGQGQPVVGKAARRERRRIEGREREGMRHRAPKAGEKGAGKQ